MMRKLLLRAIATITTFVMIVASSPLIVFANDFSVTIDGLFVHIEPSVHTRIIEGSLFAPLGPIADAIGAERLWNEERRTITVFYEDMGVALGVDNPILTVRDMITETNTTVTLPVAPRIFDDVTFVPIIYFAEVLGLYTEWDATNRVVRIRLPIPTPDRCPYIGDSTISAGLNHSLAIMEDGTLWAWGNNDNGQLGDGTTTERSYPVMVMENVAYVSAGDSHSMAITKDGTLWAWGINGRGQLGDGTTNERHYPVMIMANVISVSAGSTHTIAIQRDGTLWTWGANTRGQLGDDLQPVRQHPTMVLEEVVAASASNDFTMAVRENGSIWAWGANNLGQLGDGSTSNRRNTTPTRVADVYNDRVVSDVVSVTTGRNYTMIIRSDNSLWTWGVNNAGQLGDGTNETSHFMVMIMNDVISVSGNTSHTAAVRSDGTLWAWGDDNLGVTQRQSNSPLMITENMRVVSVGESHTIALDNDGVLWAWGNNSQGQLGNNTNESSRTPVRIMENILMPGVIPVPN